MLFSFKEKFSFIETVFILTAVCSIIGFAFVLDNNTGFGCLVDTYTLSFHNISRTILSLSLLSVGYYYQKQDFGRLLIFTEFLLWTYKLLFQKGGYVFGLGGVLPKEIVVFDFIALSLRLSLLRELFRWQVDYYFLLTFAVITMWVKVMFLR